MSLSKRESLANTVSEQRRRIQELREKRSSMVTVSHSHQQQPWQPTAAAMTSISITPPPPTPQNAGAFANAQPTASKSDKDASSSPLLAPDRAFGAVYTSMRAPSSTIAATTTPQQQHQQTQQQNHSALFHSSNAEATMSFALHPTGGHGSNNNSFSLASPGAILDADAVSMGGLSAAATADPAELLAVYYRKVRVYQHRVEREHVDAWLFERVKIMHDAESRERWSLLAAFANETAARLNGFCVERNAEEEERRLKLHTTASQRIVRMLRKQNPAIPLLLPASSSSDGGSVLDVSRVTNASVASGISGTANAPAYHHHRRHDDDEDDGNDTTVDEITDQSVLELLEQYEQTKRRTDDEAAARIHELQAQNADLVEQLREVRQQSVAQRSDIGSLQGKLSMMEGKHAERVDELKQIKRTIASTEEDRLALERRLAESERELHEQQKHMHRTLVMHEKRDLDIVERCKESEERAFAKLRKENERLLQEHARRLQEERDKRAKVKEKLAQMQAVYDECLATRTILNTELAEVQRIRTTAEAKAQTLVVASQKEHEKDLLRAERNAKELRSIIAEKDKTIEFLRNELAISSMLLGDSSIGGAN